MSAQLQYCRCQVGCCNGYVLGHKGNTALCRRKALLASTPSKEGGHARAYPPLRWYRAGFLSMWLPERGWL